MKTVDQGEARPRSTEVRPRARAAADGRPRPNKRALTKAPQDDEEPGGAPPWKVFALFVFALGLLVLYGVFGAH